MSNIYGSNEEWSENNWHSNNPNYNDGRFGNSSNYSNISSNSAASRSSSVRKGRTIQPSTAQVDGTSNKNTRIERVNANTERIWVPGSDMPRRIVIFFIHKGKRYAIKAVPAWDEHLYREIAIYKQLSQPKKQGKYAFDPRHTARYVYDGKTDISVRSSDPVVFPMRLKTGMVDIIVPKKQGRMVQRGLEQRAKSARFTQKQVPVIYLVSEAPSVFQPVQPWTKLRRSSLSTEVQNAFKMKFFYAFAPIVIRAHLTYGFIHWDLHPGNMLCKITYKGKILTQINQLPRDIDSMKHVHIVPKMFDYDVSTSVVSYSSTIDPKLKRFSRQRNVNVMIEEILNGYPKSKWFPFGPVYDLANLHVHFISRENKQGRTNAQAFVPRIYPRARPELIKIMEMVEYVARKHTKSNVGEFILTMENMMKKKMIPPTLYPKFKL